MLFEIVRMQSDQPWQQTLTTSVVGQGDALSSVHVANPHTFDRKRTVAFLIDRDDAGMHYTES